MEDEQNTQEVCLRVREEERSDSLTRAAEIYSSRAKTIDGDGEK